MGYPISEARRQLPTLVRRVVENHEEFLLGERGSDAVTLVATSVYQHTKALAQQALVWQAAAPSPSNGRPPFVTLQNAFRIGQITPAAPRVGPPSIAQEFEISPALRRPRRYIPDFQVESRLDERAQAALGTRQSSKRPS